MPVHCTSCKDYGRSATHDGGYQNKRILHDDRELINKSNPASGLVAKASIHPCCLKCIRDKLFHLLRERTSGTLKLRNPHHPREPINIEDYHELIAKLTQTLQQQGLLEDEVKEFAVDIFNTTHFSLDISWLFGDYYHQDMPDILRTTETNKLSTNLCERLRVLIHISRRRLGISQKYLQRANQRLSQICPNLVPYMRTSKVETGRECCQ